MLQLNTMCPWSSKHKEVGMIIVGKANLGELKRFKDQNNSPAWSALARESISPHDGKVRTFQRCQQAQLIGPKASVRFIRRFRRRGRSWLRTIGDWKCHARLHQLSCLIHSSVRPQAVNGIDIAKWCFTSLHHPRWGESFATR